MSRIKYDFEKLKDPQVLSDFQAITGGRFGPFLLENVTPDNFALQFEKSVEEVVIKHLGKKKRIEKPWITAEVSKCDERRSSNNSDSTMTSLLKVPRSK